jgi:predicted small lipoprotein YifL
MKTILHRTLPALLSAALLVFSLSACGVKGPVKPPLSRSPSAAKDLAVRQIGERLLVSWNLPKTNQDGSPLELQGFEVFRNAYDPVAGCAECGQTQDPFLVIDLEYLQNVTRDGDRLSFQETGLTPDSGYLYRVLAVDRRGAKGAEASAKTVFHTAPPAPRPPAATRETQGVRLNWSSSPGETREAGFIGYNLYRLAQDRALPLTPVNPEPLIDPTYLDVQVAPDGKPAYVLRSLWRMGGQLVESTDSTPGRPK